MSAAEDIRLQREHDGVIRWSAWSGASWRDALKAAATRRDFPNLLFAEKWIRSLSTAGLYPRWWGDDKGE